VPFSSLSNRSKAITQLFTAALIWGASFTLVIWALESFSTSQILFWRFLIGYLLGEFILFAFNRKEFKASHSDFKIARYTGIALGLSLLFQIYGLKFTTATNSGFITATYVVMIPFVSFVVSKQKIKWLDVGFAVLALFGISLLLNLESLSNVAPNKGDLLTILSAVCAAIQIIYIGIFAKTCISPFRYNNFQNLWGLIITVPFLIYEMSTTSSGFIPEQISWKSAISLITLALAVTMLAFYLQIKAQKNLPITISSMLCLLEAPFSFLFAALLIGEHINFIQGVGAAIIMTSAALAIYFDRH
jgi:drug/metabolite transporter (DMT)-like permease